MSDFVDPKYKKLRNLLESANGEITPEIKEEIDNLTKGKEAEDFNKIFSSIENTVSTEDILSRISKIPLPKVFLDSIASTFKTTLAPTKLAFMEEVQNYIKVISKNNSQSVRKIPRTVKKSELKKLENGKFVLAFPNADPSEKVINPEFKNLLTNGYKPPDIEEYQKEFKKEKPGLFENPPEPPRENSDPFTDYRIGLLKPEIGTPDTDFLKNYIGGDQPSVRIEEIPYTISEPAGLLKDSYKLKPEEVEIKIDNSNLVINITGTMRIETAGEQLVNSTLYGNLPSWKISYLETKNRYFLNIKNNLQYFPTERLTAETSSYRFSGKIPESSMSQEALDLIGVLSDQCDVQLGDDLFSSLLKLENVVKTMPGETPRNKNLYSIEKTELKEYLKSSYKELFDSIVRQSFGNLNNNRLLKKFNPNPDLYSDTDSPINLIILNLINFVPNSSQELVDCNKNPHPLNMDEVLLLITEKFREIGIEAVPLDNGIDEKKEPTSEALAVGVAYMIVRLLVFEFLLKNLIVFDELGYSSTINGGPIIKDYLSILVKKELESLGIYKAIEKIVEENYSFFINNDIIREEDTVEEQDDFKSIVDNSSFIKPSKNFKIFTTAMLRKIIGFTKNLIGVSDDMPKGDLIIGSKIYDVVSRSNLSTDVEIKHNGLDIKRLQEFKDFKQFVMLEKYINSPLMIKEIFEDNLAAFRERDKQIDMGGANITSFKEYSVLLYKLINYSDNFNVERLKQGNLKNHIVTNNGKINNISNLKQLFGNNKPKIAIRLNYVKRENIFSLRPLEIDNRLLEINNPFIDARTSSENDGTTIENRYYSHDEILSIIQDLEQRLATAIELRTQRSNRTKPGKNQPTDPGVTFAIKSESELPLDAELQFNGDEQTITTRNSLTDPSESKTYTGKLYKSKSEGRSTGAKIIIDPINGVNIDFEWPVDLEQTIANWREKLEGIYDITPTQQRQTKNITGIQKDFYSSFYQSAGDKFYIKQNKEKYVSIILNEIKDNRQYCFFDDQPDGIYQFNSLPVSKHEIEFDLEEIFTTNDNLSELSIVDISILLNRLYERKKSNIILNLKSSSNYQLLMNKAIGIDRINNLMSIYSTSALSNVGMEKLFQRTKQNLFDLLKTVENLENYEYKSEASKRGYDNLYLSDIEQIGNPNANPSILKFLIQTPILILKGLLNVTDPNMSISFLIQDIAAAGLLFPKVDEQGKIIGYPGDKLIIPSSLISLAQLPINVFGPYGFGYGPPFTIPYAPIYWVLETLLWDWPFYKNSIGQTKAASELSRKYNGLNVFGNFTCSRNQDDN